VYKAETLFLRGVNPWRPVGEVADLTAMVGLAKRLLEANKERFGQVTTGSRRRGEETWVYGRAGRPCRRCGTPVRTARPGERPGEPGHLLVPSLSDLILLRYGCRPVPGPAARPRAPVPGKTAGTGASLVPVRRRGCGSRPARR
jgi:hypothetical protein